MCVQNILIIIFSQMGTQCVRPCLRESSQYGMKQPSSPYRLRGKDEKLNFVLCISDLELHCPPQQISNINFVVRECFQIGFTADEFSIHQTMIKSTKSKEIAFEAPARNLQFLDFVVSIENGKGDIVEVISLKLHAVCQGPQHHDHLLKEMKARIIYNLEISQVISSQFSCSNFCVQEHPKKNPQSQFGFLMELVTPDNEDCSQDDKMVFLPKNPEQSDKLLTKRIPMNILKKSILKITILKFSPKNQLTSNPFTQLQHIFMPIRKFLDHDEVCVLLEIKGSMEFQKRKLKYQGHITTDDGQKVDVKMDLFCCTSKVYLEQLDCLVFSGKQYNVIPPHQLQAKQREGIVPLTMKDLTQFEIQLKKFKEVTFQSKQMLQKTVKQCCQKLKQKDGKPCLIKQLEEIQLTLVNIIKILSNLITEGEDITNQVIWTLINKIIHRPELTTRYLSLVDEDKKSDIGLKHFQFMIVLLQKIIHCTEVGLTYHELKCIQKFVAYAFFRFQWVRDILIKTLSRPDDPIFTTEKLMEIGVFVGCKSPSKAIIFDWQYWMNFLKKDPRYKKLEKSLTQTSEDNPQWAELIFNRDDQDLFYGILMEIWTQAEIFLSNQGRIQWEYFPCYAQLLGAFLGQMNKNQIKQYSSQFRQCSIKLISNQKLLNSFVALLFPKTCLYETYCVIKCLQLLKCYFQAISLQGKKIPPQFNFNYFYTGIKSIFQSNHSYLLIKVISLLYDYYHIFSNDFKKSLDMYLFDRNFFRVFLHWCGHVRKVFYLLLEYRIALKFREIGKNSSNRDSRSLPLENISRMHQYHNFIEKLKEEQDKITAKRSLFVRHSIQDQYYAKMKSKAMQRKLKGVKKQVNQKNHFDMTNSCHDSPQVRKRIDSTVDMVKFNRKWSVNMGQESGNCAQNFTEEQRKYIPSAMKQYLDIKNISDPNAQMVKIMKHFEGGGRSVDA